MREGAHRSLAPLAMAARIIARCVCLASLDTGSIKPILTELAISSPERHPENTLEVASKTCRFFRASLVGKLWPIRKIIDRTAPRDPATLETTRKYADSPHISVSQARSSHSPNPKTAQ